MIVYKYLRPDRTDVLASSRIRFTQPAVLNDPFETLPAFTEYRTALGRAIASKRPIRGDNANAVNVADSLLPTLVDTVLSNFAKLLSRDFGVLSLSRCRDDILMWSHYADSHRGFVVGFDSENDFFSPAKNGRAVDGLRDVRYSQKRAVLPASGLDGLSPNEMRRWNERILFTKSSHWSYEQEMRVLASPSAADHRIPVPGEWDVCLFRFESSAVKEIIIGSRASLELRQQLVQLWLEKYSHAGLSSAVIHDSEFRIELNPIHGGQAAEPLLMPTRSADDASPHHC